MNDTSNTIADLMQDMGKKAQVAARTLADADTKIKRAALLAAAREIQKAE